MPKTSGSGNRPTRCCGSSGPISPQTGFRPPSGWAVAKAEATTISAGWALDWNLWINGWLKSASPGSAERCEPWSDQWTPPPQLAEMARQKLPRRVRQHWGMSPAESRTQMIYPDVALSCCGAAYGNQDSTLAVDLPGGRDLPRCYFIADGREDPYGKLKVGTGAAQHPKSLHLQPFWAGAQRGCDALGVVIYRQKDIAGAEVSHVQSHFVFPRPDEIWLDGETPTWHKGTAAKPAETPMPGLRLMVRYGSAAVGVFLPWTKERGPNSPVEKLVDDGNAWNCLRVTVDYGRRPSLQSVRTGEAFASDVIWVRVGSGLKSDADFAKWREQFEIAKVTISGKYGKRFEVEVQGKDGPLSVAADAPWDASSKVRLVPPPYQGVLEVNGKEVGRPLLTAAEPLSSLPHDRGPLECIKVAPGKAAYWDAADGLVLPGMTVHEDVAMAGRRYVVQEPSTFGEPSGIALWSLQVEKPGRYWLWAHVRSSDAKQGKFEIRVIGEEGATMRPADWLLRSSGDWQWKPLEIGGNTSPLPLDLPKGLVRIALQTRQSGTCIDRLMLTDDSRQRPK